VYCRRRNGGFPARAERHETRGGGDEWKACAKISPHAFSLCDPVALQTWPGARRGVDVDGLARVIDRFFRALLAEALRASKTGRDRWLDAAAHIVFHALFVDARRE